MPTPQPKSNAEISGASPISGNGIRSGLIGVFILACLVLPGVIWRHHEQPLAPITPTTTVSEAVSEAVSHVVSEAVSHVSSEVVSEVVSEAWLEFIDPLFDTVTFIAAHPLDVHLGIVRVESDEAEEVVQVDPLDQREWWLHSPAVDRLLLLEDQLTPSRRSIYNGQLNYKVTPSFNFENRELQLRGLMIRLWIHF
jgi:hypothetical protein